MASDELSPVIPASFDGVVRLFPLPNIVFFPHVVLPLHIFEPRYCELVEAALAGDRLIAMAMLLPGWEEEATERPSFAPVACLGKIISHARLPGGRHNIMLAGLKRAAIAKELPLNKSYREAKVELLDDFYPASGAALRPQLQRQLLDSFQRFVPKTSLAQEQFEQLLAQQISLGMLTDIVAFTVNLPLPLKQQLLSEWQVDRRAQQLLAHMRQLLSPHSVQEPACAFPPQFSPN